MARILLLGAGFSRNWNGWLADEIMGKLLARLSEDRELHGVLNSSPNFEDAISKVQQDFRNSPSPANRDRLDRMQAAVLSTFRAMNESFAKRPSMEFSNYRHFSIINFLNRFDAIFTLNQDLLLELHYGHLELAEPRRWNGPYFPGMQVPGGWHSATGPLVRDRLGMTWRPAAELRTEDRVQPIYKLHGSVNWKEGDGDMLVLGGNKAGMIAGSRLLKWYGEEFRRYLAMPDPRLMVIGYGFRDDHINQLLLVSGQNHGLRMYIVDPRGRRVLERNAPAPIKVRHALEEIPVIGESLRPLTSTFNGDDLEHDDLLGFFQ